jgi:hypothetical protein
MVWNMYRYKNIKETGIELLKLKTCRRIRPIKICFSSLSHEIRNEWYSRVCRFIERRDWEAARIFIESGVRAQYYYDIVDISKNRSRTNGSCTTSEH